MPPKPISYDDLFRTVDTVRMFVDRGYELDAPTGKHGSGAKRKAAELLGIDRTSIHHRLREAERRYNMTPQNIHIPAEIEFDDDRPDPLEIINRHARINSEYIAKARKKPAMFMVKPEPFCVAFVGDPHLTNKGCNLNAIKADLQLLAATQTRAVQMGDILDNFHATGKLASKEAQNHLTIKEGLSVAKWMIAESGVKWDAHILGNHDHWIGPEGAALIGEWVNQARSKLFDWNSTLIYRWGDGPRDMHVVAASHDFKGHSQYNPMHGPAKMALFDGTADTYVAAHRHNHGDAKLPNGYRDKTYQLVRVRGYKDHDDYASGRAQFPQYSQMEGRSAALVINPLSQTHDGRQRVFMDIAEGIEFAEMLKKRAA